jgi:TonB family protein
METNRELETANDRFKRRGGETLWYSIAAGVVLHAAVFAFWPQMSAAGVADRADPLVAMDLPVDLDIPPAPEELARPAAPLISTTDISEDVTIAPTTFEEFTPERLPAPPQATRVDDDLRDAPRMVPRTVEPELLNRRQVEDALLRNYPPILREAGVGGIATVWFFIDEDGRVERRLLNRKSGYDALDEAALRVAETMRFSPALNGSRKVPVWVEIPIVFTIR